MSKINGKPSAEWIIKNHPQNGLFRVYWKDVVDFRSGGVTFDPEDGDGLRYEWYYKNGKKNGLSKGWWPNGQLKSKLNMDRKDRLCIGWHENGQKKYEVTYKDGKEDGLYTRWYENGEKKKEVTYKNGNKISLKEWNEK